jgi:hypothetical protein
VTAARKIEPSTKPIELLANMTSDHVIEAFETRVVIAGNALFPWLRSSKDSSLIATDATMLLWWARDGKEGRTAVGNLVNTMQRLTRAFGWGEPGRGEDPPRPTWPRSAAPTDALDLVVQAGWARAILHDRSPVRAHVYAGQLALLASTSDMSVQRAKESGALVVAVPGDKRYRQTTYTMRSARAWLKDRGVAGFSS